VTGAGETVYLQDHLPFRFEPVDRTLPAILTAQAARFGDKRLLTCRGEAWTYAETRDIAAQMAGALQAADIRKGDRVAVMCNNAPEFVKLFLGASWLGAVTVPINTACKGPQIRYALENSGARFLAIAADLQPILELSDLSGLPLVGIWVIGGPVPRSIQSRPCSPMPERGELLPPAPTRPGDTLAILYTSGTTGPSKGVLCPHAQYFWWGAQSSRLLGVTASDVLLTALPLFHINALNTFAQALLTGATQVVEARFSASAFWTTLQSNDATVTYLLGAMVPILLARPPCDAEKTHRVRIALGPGVPDHLHEAFRTRTGITLLDGYGSTETNFVIGGPVPEQRAGMMGRICPGFAARVVDKDDNEVPVGTSGELVLRAEEPFAFATGYFGMPEKTVEAWRNLWFHTGDRVVRDVDGRFRFVDRLKDVIRRRGENISSFEVEQVLLSHPEIESAAAYPVVSDLAEDEVMAALVRKPGSCVGAADILRFCEPRLPYFAVPRFIEFFDDLPRTENGKVQKFQLRDRGVTAATWDRQSAGFEFNRR
jgi:crotonobetaine/carnitine-CoA ligase